ncbi:CCA tRNA nucleotidyltransferase [Candidatus Parcubacteria bacterium]|nr:MAG: CCA tRNA nucleotidyltransferase [Candidatus Parcubacteria bacterium]
MHGGFFTLYSNHNLTPEQRVKIFIDKEQRIQWTQQFLKETPTTNIYLVGGSIRDILLGKLPKDLDLIIAGADQSEIEKQLQRYGKLEILEKEFGAFKFWPKNFLKDKPLDITLPRLEQISDHHLSGRKSLKIKPDPLLDIENDLARRDFTINAIAYDFKNKKIIDPFFGITDLEQGVIRSVLNPRQRFFEDATRILRGLRFAAQLNFAIENRTWQAIKDNIYLLNNTILDENGNYIFITPRSAIGREFLLGFFHHPTHTLNLWNESGALSSLMPEIANLNSIIEDGGETAMQKTLKILNFLHKKELLNKHELQSPTATTLIAGLFSFFPDKDVGKKLMTRLHFFQFEKNHNLKIKINDVIKMLDLLNIFENTDPAGMRPALFEKKFTSETGRQLLFLIDAYYAASGKFTIGRDRAHIALRLAKQMKNNPPKLISGSDIKQLGIQPGPIYRILIDKVRDEQLLGKITNKEQALNFIKQEINK